jgi:hypothetical protein
MINTIPDRHGISQPGVIQHVAADLRADLDRDQTDASAGQCVSGGIRAEGISKQQDHRAKNGW